MKVPAVTHPAPGVAVYLVRGEQVILDADVADAFGVTTSALNQAVARNPSKFTDEHTFVLGAEEAARLRSQRVISNGRGGARYAPRVYTALGIARLATVLNSPQALAATDLMLRTFLHLRAHAVAGGRLPQPDNQGRRVKTSGSDDLRTRLQTALSKLLDVVADADTGRNVRQVGSEFSSGAIDNIRQRLRAKGLENEKLEADTILVLAQAEKVYAETRKTHAEAQKIETDSLQQRIDTVRALHLMLLDSEPGGFVRLLSQADAAEPFVIAPPPALPAPDTD